MTPRFPNPADVRPASAAESRDSATCLAMVGLLALCVALAFLIGMIIPTAYYVMLLVAALGGIFALHYLVWGRLLGRAGEDSPGAVKFWEQRPPADADPDDLE